MKKRSSLASIFSEFLTRYPRQFALLFMMLFVEGFVATLSILAVVPMADFLLDASLKNPSRITQVAIAVFTAFGWPVTFLTFGALFVAFNLFKGLLEVGIRYAILRIKYAVVRGLFGDALRTFFKARWEFFSGSDQGRLLNTLNKELNTIGDTLGHMTTQLAQDVQMCIYLAVPLWLSAKLTLTAIGLALLFGVPFVF